MAVKMKHTIRLPFAVSIAFLTGDCSKVQHYSPIEAAKAAYSNEAKVGELCGAYWCAGVSAITLAHKGEKRRIEP